MKPQKITQLANACILIIALAVIAVYLKRIDLTLICHISQPFFSTLPSFFKAHIIKPQGLSEYLGLYIFQFYENENTAILLTLLQIIAFGVLLSFIVKEYLPVSFITIPILVSAFPILLMYGNYIKDMSKNDFSYYLLLAYIIALLLYLAYSKIKVPKLIRYGLYLATGILVYHFTGLHGFLLFTALGILESIKNKQYLQVPIQIMISLAIITGAIILNFEINSVKDMLEKYYTSQYYTSGYLWASAVPLILLLAIGAGLFLKNEKLKTPKIWYLALPLITGIILFNILFTRGINENVKKGIIIDQYAYDQQWNKLFKEITDNMINVDIITQYFYRALYNTNNLLEYMFRCPPIYQQKGLIAENTNNISYAMPLSDLYYNMGFINESRHWANEACTVIGWQPRILKRLVKTYLITGQYAVAEKYINILESSPVNKIWAKKYRRYLYHDELVEQDAILGGLRKCNPRSDFFADTFDPYYNLQYMNADKIPSKMVFEYYIAYNLLLNKPGEIIKMIPRFKELGYSKLPTNCQEAIILFKTMQNNFDFTDLQGYQIDNKILKDFGDFVKIHTQYKNQPDTDINALKKYQHTYWFYFVYPNYFKTIYNIK